MSIEFTFDEVRLEGGREPKADFEYLLWIIANFYIRVSDVEVFCEEDFPIVEFASQVALWLRTGGVSDFQYDSMESATVGLVYFHRRTDGAWDIGSKAPQWCRVAVVSDDELRLGLRTFLASVPSRLLPLRLDVRRFLDGNLNEN